MIKGDQDFDLPRLLEGLQLEKGPANPDGSPTYTLHNSASNKYYKLDWAEFECLRRFHQYPTAASLEKAISEETPLDVSLDDIRALVDFLLRNGLVTLEDQRRFRSLEHGRGQHKNPWLHFFKTYLFFRIPLINPQQLLENLYPKVRFIFTKPFLYAGLFVLVFGLGLVLQRIDEFMATFVYMFSLPGLITTFLVFALIKVIHEMTHALTAYKYGVEVPHMGVAFIICYPVLYTEVSGSWRLQDRHQRLLIGLSGVLSELVVAGVFLLLWVLTPQGLIGSISFTVVIVSLVSSLLINLNPLMRFDGYYVLADWLGLDNLQFRAIAFARWRLREWLFKLNDPRPEPAQKDLQKFLIWFGFALLIYRALLFIGIAIALYLIFFKPLGLILMVLELGLLVIWPIVGELKIWWRRRHDIAQTKRSRITAAFVALAALIFFIPWQSDVRAPAVLTAQEYRAIYPPVPATINSVHVSPGAKVKEGDLLVQLSAPDLDHQIEKARLDLEKARTRKRLFNVARHTPDSTEKSRPALALQEKVNEARENLNQLLENKERLRVTSPFDGVIRDLNPDIRPGLTVKASDFLLRVIAPGAYNVTAYLSEADIGRVQTGYKGAFFPHHSLGVYIPSTVDRVAQSNVTDLAWLSLASIYGGDIPVATDSTETSRNRIELRRNKYQVTLKPFVPSLSNRQKRFLQDNNRVIHGYVRISGDSTSLFRQAVRSIAALMAKEININ